MPLDLYTHVQRLARVYVAEHSARALAHAAGCDHAQILRWLRSDAGHRDLRAELFCRVAKIVGVKVKGGAK